MRTLILLLAVAALCGVLSGCRGNSSASSLEPASTMLHARPEDLSALDVVGLRLGMTVGDAREQLQKYKRDLWITTGYLTEDTQWWGDNLGMTPQMDLRDSSYHPFRSAKLHIPVAMVAGYFDKVYYYDGSVIDNKDTPFHEWSGEALRLSFTPNDRGGRLYSIVRRRVYFSNPGSAYKASGISFPRVADLENSAFEKYGKPAHTDTSSGDHFWISDVRGRSLPPSHPDFFRCAAQLTKASGYGLFRGDALRDLSEAFDNRELSSSKHTHRVTGPDSVIRDFVMLVPTKEPWEENRFRGCGTQLYVSVDRLSDPSGRSEVATAMTVALSDQNAQQFDNGRAAYMKAQVAKVQPSSPPAKKEQF